MDTSPEPIIVSVTVLSQMFLYLDSLNVDIDAFLRPLGVDPQSVRAPDTRLPIETYLLIQDKATEYVNDPFGFSEPSVFRKAFKKWSGVTPREYREGAFTMTSQI